MPDGRAGTGYIEIRPELTDGFVGDLNRQVAAALVRVKGDIKLDVDQGHINAGLANAERSFSGHFAKLGGMAKAAGAAIATGLVAGGALAVVGFGKIGYDAVQAASDVGESQSKNTVLFGDNAAAVNEWAKTTATAMGISRNESLAAAGVFGALFRPMGIAESAAADMSTQMVNLAGDMASFNNANPQEVLDALRSGLTGESEPLRRYGVLLDEATLKQTAYAKGIAQVGSDLTPAQKAQAAYAAILEQTALQQGDAARTSDSFANRQRQVSAQWQDLMATMGEKFLPVAQQVMGWLSTTGMPILERIGASVGRLFELIGAGDWAGAWAMIQGGLSGIWSTITGWIDANKPAIAEKAKELGGALLDWATQAARDLLDKLGPLLVSLGEWVQNTAVPYIEANWQTWLSAFTGWIAEVWPKFVEHLWGFLGTLGKWIVTDAAPWIIAKVSEWTWAFMSWLGGAIKDLPGKLLEWLGALGSWVLTDALPALGRMGTDMLNAFVAWLKDLPGKAKDAGGDLIAGLWQGLKDKLKEILDGIGGLAKPLVDAFKSAFGIASPAKVMMPIGEQIAAGLAVGFGHYNLADALSANARADLAISGGMAIPPPPRPTVPAFAAAGAPSGLVINNHVRSGADAAEVADLVTAKTIWKMQR